MSPLAWMTILIFLGIESLSFLLYIVLGHVLGPYHPEPGGPDAAEGQLMAEFDLAPGL